MAVNSPIVEVANQWHRWLEQHETSAVMEMAHFWRGAAESIDDSIYQLMDEIDVARNEPWFDPMREEAWARELRHFEELKAQTMGEYAYFMTQSRDLTDQYAFVAMEMGRDEADALIKNAYGGVAPEFYSFTPNEALESLYGAMRQAAPLEDYFLPDMGFMTWNHMKKELAGGMVRGLPASQIARNMSKAAHLGYNRALTIARTEINRAHHVGTERTYMNSGVVRAFKRFANKSKACMACLLKDGTLYEFNDGISAEGFLPGFGQVGEQTALAPVGGSYVTKDYKLFTDHPNGGCTLVPHVEDVPYPPSWETGKQYFEKLPEEEQRRRMGNDYYESWKDGNFSLDNMADWMDNGTWGTPPGVVPLWKLEGYSSAEDRWAKTRKHPKAKAPAVEKMERDLDSRLAQLQHNADLHWQDVRRRGNDPDEFDWYYDEQFAMDLTEDQRRALEHYTGSAYSDWNHYLRTGQVYDWLDEDQMARQIDLANQALIYETPPIQEDTVVWRKFSVGHGKTIEDYGFTGENQPWSDPAFLSSSIKDDVWHGEVELEIFVPKGSTGCAYIEMLTFNTDEYEMLFHTDAKFWVRKIDATEHKTRIELIYLGGPEDD